MISSVKGTTIFEPLLGGLEILELPRPLDVIAGRELHPFADALGGGFDVAARCRRW